MDKKLPARLRETFKTRKYMGKKKKKKHKYVGKKQKKPTPPRAF